ncbi:MAG: hypothetical protein HC796_00840 [Synechococcaceae cyanobacterium RL_1_2]|nr:hypothetical protein [Synechococcaceae cyanobacterium RL_1_2]
MIIYTVIKIANQTDQPVIAIAFLVVLARSWIGPITPLPPPGPQNWGDYITTRSLLF